jgi:copper chaperone CopZ
MSAKMPAKPSKDVIYVDVEDEITGIIDKVENSEHKVVALVLPKRAASLQSIVNMKLLSRSAGSSGKNVVLITSEKALMPLAGAAGLHVARNLQSRPEVPEGPAGLPAAAAADEELSEEVPEEENGSEEDLPAKFDYDKPVGALAAAHEADNPETIDLDDEDEEAPKAASKKSAVEKVSVPNFDRFRLMMGLGIAGLIALIAFIILALFVLPKAAVTIHTTSEPLTANFNLTANAATPALDTAKGVLPAKLETKDQTGTQQVTATGQQNNGTKATGSVAMTVCASSPGQVSNVPSGTGVSVNGLSYITQQTANFSFSGSCNGGSSFKFQSNSVDVSAVQGGAKYNTSINGASVANSNATADGSASGGTDNMVTVLSQNDVNGAKDKLTSGTAADDFTKSFKQGLEKQGEYVLSSTLKAGDPNITSTPSVGQPASTATVTIKVTYTVLTIKKSDLSQAIQAKLASQIDKTKQKLNGDFVNDTDVTVQNQPAKDSAILSLEVNTTAVPIISEAAVKKQAEGKKAGDVEQAINNWPGVKSVKVDLSPFWVSKVPKKDAKVTVKMVEDKASATNGAP